ncbi:hypothetical protein COOONC_18333 [Cooperia oncophora]
MRMITSVLNHIGRMKFWIVWCQSMISMLAVMWTMSIGTLSRETRLA